MIIVQYKRKFMDGYLFAPPAVASALGILVSVRICRDGVRCQRWRCATGISSGQRWDRVTLSEINGASARIFDRVSTKHQS